MSDPQRMLDGNVPPHIRLLLEAGRDAEPRSSLVEMTLQSLRAAELGAAPGGLSSVTSAMVVPALLGALSLGALVGVTWMLMTPAAPDASTAVSPISHPADEPSQERAAVDDAPSASVASATPDDDLRPASSGALAPSRQGPQRVVTLPGGADVRQPPPRPPATVQRELVLRARAELDRGLPQRTLMILAGYESSFEELRFVPEVLSLRMQAYQAMGHGETAQQLARDLIAKYPRSSQAGRARQLLQEGGVAEK